MFEPRLRFLASDDDFDDFAFEDETVDLEFEIGEYRLDDHDDEPDPIAAAIVFVPSPVVVIAALVPSRTPASIRVLSNKLPPKSSIAPRIKVTPKPIAKKKIVKKATKKAAAKTAPVKKAPVKKTPVKKVPKKKVPTKKKVAKKAPLKRKRPGAPRPVLVLQKKLSAKKANKTTAKKK